MSDLPIKTKKVAIFTTFLGVDMAYSLISVASDQINMLKRKGYNPVVIVGKGFKPKGAFEGVELRNIPPVRLSNQGELLDNYQEEIKMMTDALREILKDIEVCMTHDIIYQPAHLIHNVAARRIALERPDLKWLHWIHSATSPSILCNKDEVRAEITRAFPNSFICYPNTFDIGRVAKNFGFEERHVKHVPHAIDLPEFYGFTDLSKEFVDKYNILGAEAIMVYPCRLDRGKQPQMNIKIMAALKRMGITVRLIIMDFHSTGGDKVTYRNELRSIHAARNGLTENEVIFTSEFKPETKSSCPRAMVRDMFLLANIYCHPSVSETYSLTTQEAAMCSNMIILNYDFPPMRTIYEDYPLYYKFSSNIDMLSGENGDTVTKYDNEKGYFNNIAMRILYEFRYNRILALRNELRLKRNLDYVFRNYIEPLLYTEVE